GAERLDMVDHEIPPCAVRLLEAYANLLLERREERRRFGRVAAAVGPMDPGCALVGMEFQAEHESVRDAGAIDDKRGQRGREPVGERAKLEIGEFPDDIGSVAAHRQVAAGRRRRAEAERGGIVWHAVAGLYRFDL